MRRLEREMSDKAHEREKEYQFEATLLKKEKNDYEEQRERDEKKLQLKVFELDERKKALVEEEADFLKRTQLLEEKRNTVLKEREELRLKVVEFEQERESFAVQYKRVQELSLKANEESEFVSRHKAEFEDNKCELDRMRYEIEAEKAHLQAEQFRMDETRRELGQRQRMIEALSLKAQGEDHGIGMSKYSASAGPQLVDHFARGPRDNKENSRFHQGYDYEGEAAATVGRYTPKFNFKEYMMGLERDDGRSKRAFEEYITKGKEQLKRDLSDLHASNYEERKAPH